MHVVSTNFAKTLVVNLIMTSYYDVTFHKQRISSNNDHNTPRLILEFGRGASNQAVTPGITRPLHATGHKSQKARARKLVYGLQKQT